MEEDEGSQPEVQKIIYSKANKTLHIYCPPELANDFINFAKEEFDDKQYLALKELLRNWRDNKNIAYMQTDIRVLQEAVAELMTPKEAKEDKKEEKEHPNIRRNS